MQDNGPYGVYKWTQVYSTEERARSALCKKMTQQLIAERWELVLQPTTNRIKDDITREQIVMHWRSMNRLSWIYDIKQHTVDCADGSAYSASS